MSVQKPLFKKILVASMSVMMLLVASPLAMAGGDWYHGANGQYFSNDDFWDASFKVNAYQLDGWAGFCWNTPNNFFEGYDLFVTEGNFVGGLTNYTPKTLPRSSKCYTYPKNLKNGGTVSVQVYPYIELEGGARKYIQPGTKTSIKVSQVAEPVINPISLSVTGWSNGLPRLRWNKFTGATFSGYAVFVAEGKVSANEATYGKPFYLSKYATSYQMKKMKENTTYTVVMMPYVEVSTGQKMINKGSSGALVVTTGTTY